MSHCRLHKKYIQKISYMYGECSADMFSATFMLRA